MTRASRAGLAPALALLALLATSAAASAQTVNVEVDWMADAHHSHKPQQSEIDAVVQMFACHGITLNVVLDQAIPETALLGSTTSALFFSDTTSSNTFGHLRARYFNHAGQAGWHYCVFGHDYQITGGVTGSSGLSELPGYGFLVAMGSFPSPSTTSIGTPWERAATFAHELGHNFGLTHAGAMSEGVVGPAMANFPSIMSYMYQLRGVKTHMQCLGLVGVAHLFKDLDYSNGRLPILNEAVLNEAQGLGIVPVDWNCDGTVGGIVAHALNDTLNDGYWCDARRPTYAVFDRNDWTVVLNSIAHPPTPEMVQAPTELCISHQQMLLSTLSATSCAIVEPTPTIESCPGGDMYWVDPANTGIQLGTGNAPFNSLVSAMGSSLNGSVLYLKPGTYSIGGTGVISKPVTLSGAQPFTVVP